MRVCVCDGERYREITVYLCVCVCVRERERERVHVLCVVNEFSLAKSSSVYTCVPDSM